MSYFPISLKDVRTEPMCSKFTLNVSEYKEHCGTVIVDFYISVWIIFETAADAVDVPSINLLGNHYDTFSRIVC